MMKCDVKCLWQERTTSNDQIHAGELDLVNWGLLGREGAELIRGDHCFLAFLLGTDGRRSSGLNAFRGDTNISWLTTCSSNRAITLMWVGRNGDIPDSNSAVGATGGENSCLDAEGEGPDTAFAMAAAAFK